MLVMEFARWLIVVTSLTLRLTRGLRAVMHPEGTVYAPMDVSHTVEVECEVSEGEKPHWQMNGADLYTDDNIVINNDGNRSVARIGDAGFDSFNMVNTGSNKVNRITVFNLRCSGLQSVGLKLQNEPAKLRIIRFGAPDKPWPITVSRKAGKVSWGRPLNMRGVRLVYVAVMVDTASGATVFNETITEPRVFITVPECYNITVLAKNKAGISEPSIKESCTEVTVSDIDLPPTNPALYISASAAISVTAVVVAVLSQ